MDTVEDFMILPRRQLQMLCKQAGIRANATNKEMAEALERLAQVRMQTGSVLQFESTKELPERIFCSLGRPCPQDSFGI